MLVLSRLWAAETSHKMTVTRDPNCGHRGGWLAYVGAVGFPDLIEAANLAPLKARLGMPRLPDLLRYGGSWRPCCGEEEALLDVNWQWPPIVAYAIYMRLIRICRKRCI